MTSTTAAMKCVLHDAREAASLCSCSDIVKALRLPAADIEKLKDLSKVINRTAYHGGIGLEESGKYLALLDRILALHGQEVA